MKLSVASFLSALLPLGTLWLSSCGGGGGRGVVAFSVLPSPTLSTTSTPSSIINHIMKSSRAPFLTGRSSSSMAIRAVSGDLSDGHDFDNEDEDTECVVSKAAAAKENNQDTAAAAAAAAVTTEVPDRRDSLIQEILSGPPEAPWAVVNGFEMLLNQCCLQSFLFLVRSMRDIQTVLWMEHFVQPTIQLIDEKHPVAAAAAANLTGGRSDNIKLLSYHGLGALNTTRFPTWDSLFAKLLEQPKKYFIVESGFRHIPDYEMEINPASLCSRIISVREQIAREWVKDLSVIAEMGNHTLTSYWDGIQQQRNITTTTTSSSSSSSSSRTTTGGSINRKKNITAEERIVAASKMLFLELGCNQDAEPSPLRKGNFDLLLLLATQESIHRILNSPTATDNSTRQYLQNFYLQRLESHFCNTHRYDLADHFLKELLAEPPSVVRVAVDHHHQDSSNSNNKTAGEAVATLIDPTRLAELLLEQREQVAHEWKALAAQVPDSHIEIKRLQFNLLMSTYTTTTTTTENTTHPDEKTNEQQDNKSKKLVPVGAAIPEDKKQEEKEQPPVNKNKKKKKQARKNKRRKALVARNKTYSVGEVEDFQ